MFYTVHEVEMCPLCGNACGDESLFAHLLSPCTNLSIALPGPAGGAFIELCQAGAQALAVYAAFPVFALGLH